MAHNRSTLIYLAIAVGLLCYLTLIDKKIPGTKQQQEAENELFRFEVGDVDGLEITNVHGTFIFRKKGDHWEIKSPIKAPADAASVNEVLNEISFAQPQRLIKIDGEDKGTPATLKEWGLTPPAERAVIHTPPKTFELLIGRKMAINDSVYARTSDRKDAPVRIVPNTLKTVLEKDLADLRSRSVFDFDTGKVTRIASRVFDTTTTPAQETEVDLKDKKWVLEKPLVARASEPAVQSLFPSILGLRAIDFVTDDASNLSSYGLTSPTMTLAVTVQPQEELVLQIGGPVPKKPDQVYAQRLTSNSVFTLTKSSVDEIVRDLPNVRDRHVLPFDSTRATGLSFSFGKKNGSVLYRQSNWKTTGSYAGTADTSKVLNLFAQLGKLETTPAIKDSAPDLKPFGLDKPRGKVTVETAEKGPQTTLFIGKDENKLLYVRNSSEPFIYTLPDTAFDLLPDSNLGLLDGRAINLVLSDIKSLTITSPPAPEIVLTRSSGGTWTAANLKDRMIDSVKAETEASLFAQLQAKTWLGPVQPTYGLDQPVLIIKATGSGTSPTVLRIGATLPDGSRAAQISGSPITFSISEGDFGLLDSSTIQMIPSVLDATNAPPQIPSRPAATNAAK